jgi:hypothetical protein
VNVPGENLCVEVSAMAVLPPPASVEIVPESVATTRPERDKVKIMFAVRGWEAVFLIRAFPDQRPCAPRPAENDWTIQPSLRAGRVEGLERGGDVAIVVRLVGGGDVSLVVSVVDVVESGLDEVVVVAPGDVGVVPAAPP